MQKNYTKVLPKNKIDIFLPIISTLSIEILLLYVIIKEGVVSMAFLVAPFVILLLILIIGFQSLIETVLISTKGIKYCDIFKIIECEWKDISRIEVATKKYGSVTTGSITSSWIDYNFYTSKGDFTIKGNRWDRDAIKLKNLYEKIVANVQNAEIIQKEIVELYNDGAVC